MKIHIHFLTVPALALGLAVAVPAPVLADGNGMIETAVVAAALPDKKQTKAGLYITASEAANAVAARTDVILLDVRTPEETMLVGHPTVAAANIPFKTIDPAHGYSAQKSTYNMLPNPDFVKDVKAFLAGHDSVGTVLIMCRSGGRSAAAVDALLKAGVEAQLYTVVDGFEGDKDDRGKRSVNGWKNAGEDWTYKIGEGFLFSAE